MAALSRLSYGPKLVWRNEFTAVGWRGLMGLEVIMMLHHVFAEDGLWESRWASGLDRRTM
jgi:hypothetical protein